MGVMEMTPQAKALRLTEASALKALKIVLP